MTKLLTLSLLIFYVLSGTPLIKASDHSDEPPAKKSKSSSASKDSKTKEKHKKSKSSKASRKLKEDEGTTATIIAATATNPTNLLGSLLKEGTLQSPSHKPIFLPPTEIEIKDIILLLSTEYQQKESTYGKIYLAQYGQICNVILPIIGDEQELAKRLFLEELRKNEHVKTLLTQYAVSNPKEEINRFVDKDVVDPAKNALDALLKEKRINQVVLRTCTSNESRAASTVANHNSISSKYELYKKYKDGELVSFGKFILSLNFYRHA